MSVPCTQFNPFGSQDKPLKTLKLEMEGILQKFEEKSTPKGAELAEETKKFAKVMEGLADIVTNGHAHMIHPLVGEIAIPFSKLIVIFGGKSTDDTRSPELANLFRRMARFIQKVADLAQEPFNSDVLNVWGPIFEAFLTSKHNSFKENGALLWKKTFGSTKVPLQWPIGLRETLEKLPKRLGISLPPVAKRSQGVPLLFPDDDAMDGLAFSSEESDDFKQPNQVNDNVPDSQSSFQLSQQPAVNEMADKILIYHNKKLDPPKVPSKIATPTRKRTGRISLIDEDSCDYVPITATPPSGRRSKLTDRQKETLAQMSGPRTSINYMDEESQSGIQKSEGMKNAFRALNFEIGEDSVSVPSPKKVEKNDKKKEEIPIKRSLFSSPIKALPVVSSNGSSFDQIDEEPEVKATSPQRKRVKIDESESSIGDSQQKRRYKDTPRHCVPAESRKSLRQSAEKLRTTTSSESSNDSQNTIIMSKSDDTDLEEVAKPIEESQEALREHNSAEPNNSFAILAPMYDFDVPEAVKSPPKTPRTPSILRGSKKAVDSPMTERKRNRVHFGEDSIPKDTVSSSMTPRRKQTFESKSPNRPMTASTIESRSNSLLDMSSRTDTSAFFPSLVGCQDKVDKILNSLVTILSKQMRDSAKKSLSSFGVTTIGDFASLSKSQIEKFTWIKGKVSGAKSTLAQYEKTWNSNKKSGEDEVDMSGASAPVVEEEKLQKVPEAPTQLVVEEQSSVVQSSENQEEKLQEVSEVTAQVVVEEKSSIVQTSTNQEEKLQEVSEVTGEKSPEFVEPENAPTTNSQAKQGVQTQSADAPTASPPVETEGPTLQESVEVIEKSLEASQSPVSPMSTATSASKSEPLKIGSTGVSHKSLAPIFIGKEIKKEYASPQKAFQRKLPNVDDFLEDARILHRICGNLISAHTKKQWPIDNSKVLSEIVRAAGTFSGIVKKRGDDEEWREMEYENNEESRTVEEEVEQLVKVYKRFSRNHTSNMSNSLPWGNVMDCINESAILLENIYTERTDSS